MIRIAMVFLVGACASRQKPQVDEARLARLPPDERTALVDQRHEIDVASSNLETARVAQNDAERWRDAVKKEASAADDRLKAAREELDVNKNAAPGSQQRADAEQTLADAERRREAVAAKLQYAEDLVSLRRSQVELRRAQADRARAQQELSEVDKLQAHDKGDDLKRSEFTSARDKADAAVRDRQQSVDTRRSTIQASKGRWEQLHQKFDVAQRAGRDSNVDAPPPPQPID